MKSQCLPFRRIPHATRLFLDYLDFSPPVQQFYPRPARFLEWAKDESPRIVYPEDRRSRVADILERQNKAWAASAKTFENIARFRAGASALVTGQQVGLFGGPVFSIYKALTAVKFAEEARQLGLNCVPVFWLATEDHDLAEVNQIRLLAADGQLQRFVSTSQGATDAPVGSIHFGPEISELVAQVQTLLGESEVVRLLAECYRPGETFGTAFAKFFAQLFGDFGVVLLDGSDPELDQIAAPLYEQVVVRASELNQALLQRDQQLQAAGYHQQVRITHASTPLFVIRDGSRIPVHVDSQGSFLIGEAKQSQQEIAQMLQFSPECFSPNVLLRPVVQDYLLPTLGYVGGAAEVAYFAQVAIVYQELLGRITPILSRFSATLIETKPQALLEKYKLGIPDLFHGSEALCEAIGSRVLDAGMQASFDKADAAVARSMAAIRESLAQLDKILVESATNAE